MDYKIDKDTLLEVLEGWNTFCKRKVHLIACGGTALTLMGIKFSTKDIDFMVPKLSEYKYLTNILRDLGYNQVTGSGWHKKGELFIFDMFRGNYIHTTELLESPLREGNHTLLKEFSYLYVGVLNEYDLISSKLFRGAEVDFEDCRLLVKALKDKIDIERLERHSRELASFDISEDRINRQIDDFLSHLKKDKLYG
jgi:hypothetical protein